MREVVQQRVLGALRFMDMSTGQPIRRALRIEAEKLRLRRNRSGDYVIVRAEDPDLLKHLDAFAAPPAAPAAPVDFAFQVRDPAGEYLPRAFNIGLPRDPDPAHAADAGSLFRPVELALLPSPTRSLGANWCAVRVAVERQDTHQPVAGAAVRVQWRDAPETALGQSDGKGQALVAIPALPFHTISQNPEDHSELLLTAVDATLEIFVHKQGGVATPELVAANDPVLIKSAPENIQIAPGRLVSRTVVMTIPN